MTIREARCACAALSARTEGDPVRISICHCSECKRRTGSAFGWNATFSADRVQISGTCRTFQRGSDDGFWVKQHFCESCGVTVFYEIERRPGMISIPPGPSPTPISRRRGSKSMRKAAARG